ncbi:MAG: type II toxin-antitoxin system RelE/ParE family toxin [Acetobacteraceae bacterium]|nr:type II toxin-antitoxin system RelE/ParE family toxin [Acetobacteraceae bacterium]
MSRPLALRLTAAAEDDLAEIWAYIASEASEEVASRFIMAIEAALEPVRYFPFAAPGREAFGPGLRVAFHGSYAIYYRPLRIRSLSSACCMVLGMRRQLPDAGVFGVIQGVTAGVRRLPTCFDADPT